MELLEYQAKELLQRFHVPFPPHYLIREKKDFQHSLGGEGGVLRPQVRGECFEIHEHEIPPGDDVLLHVNAFLGKKIITSESGAEGFLIDKVLFLPKFMFHKTVSLCVGIHPPGEILVQVREGERIFSEKVTERRKLFRYQLARLVTPLALSDQLKETLAKAIEGVTAALFQYDATRIEISPFVVTEEKALLAYKVTMDVDENAFFRQKEMHEIFLHRQQTLRDKSIASSLPYIRGEGAVGCLANGMGLGMYTAAAIMKKGGDIAGIANIGDIPQEGRVMEGLQVLIRDPAVKVVCMNILTGLVDGGKLVASILKMLSVKGGEGKKFFLRLEGTNAKGGVELAKTSKVLFASSSLDEVVYAILQQNGVDNAYIG